MSDKIAEEYNYGARQIFVHRVLHGFGTLHSWTLIIWNPRGLDRIVWITESLESQNTNIYEPKNKTDQLTEKLDHFINIMQELEHVLKFLSINC